MKRIFVFILFCLLFSSFLFAFEKDKATSIYKEKLIIADFANHTKYKGLGKSLTDEIIALFVQTKRFDIMERERLQAILKEQELQISGLVRTEDAVKVGRIAGARYMIFGSVTGADATHSEEEKIIIEKTKSGRIRKEKYIRTTWNGRVTLSARLVDIETGVVLLGKTVVGSGFNEEKRPAADRSFLAEIIHQLAAKGDEEKAKELYFKQGDEKVINIAKRNAAVKLVKSFLKEFPLSGYIISQTEDKDYIVDLGTENGVNAKVNLKVLGKTEFIKHPITGEIIRARTESLGYLKVIDLGTTTSKAKFVKGEKDQVIPGLKVEVVDPIFVWHRALASFLVPGLGQFLEKRWGTGIAFILGEAALIAGAWYFHYRSTEEFITKQDLFDTTVWPEKGEQYDNARKQALIGMWVFIVAEALVHIWDAINAGYPAEKNRMLTYVNKQNSFYAFQFSQKNLKIQKSFRF